MRRKYLSLILFLTLSLASEAKKPKKSLRQEINTSAQSESAPTYSNQTCIQGWKLLSDKRLWATAIGAALIGRFVVRPFFDFLEEDALRKMDTEMAPEAIQRLEEALQAEDLMPENPIQIHFISQYHYTKRNSNRDKANIEKSQLKIASIIKKEIEAGQQPRVFSEGLTLQLNSEILSKAKKIMTSFQSKERSEKQKRLLTSAKSEEYFTGTASVILQFFPQGLPETPISSWTPQQRQLFQLDGAVKLLWATGVLDKVYPTQDTDLKQIEALIEKYQDQLPKNRPEIMEFTKIIMHDREIDALLHIARTVKADPDADGPIYLIFGSAHNFEKYSSNAFKFTYEK